MLTLLRTGLTAALVLISLLSASSRGAARQRLRDRPGVGLDLAFKSDGGSANRLGGGLAAASAERDEAESNEISTRAAVRPVRSSVNMETSLPRMPAFPISTTNI